MILELHRKLNNYYKQLNELPLENDEFSTKILSLIHITINNEKDNMIKKALRHDCIGFLMLDKETDEDNEDYYVAPKEVFQSYKDYYLDPWLLSDLLMETLKKLGKDVPLDNRKYNKKEGK